MVVGLKLWLKPIIRWRCRMIDVYKRQVTFLQTIMTPVYMLRKADCFIRFILRLFKVVDSGVCLLYTSSQNRYSRIAYHTAGVSIQKLPPGIIPLPTFLRYLYQLSLIHIFSLQRNCCKSRKEDLWKTEENSSQRLYSSVRPCFPTTCLLYTSVTLVPGVKLIFPWTGIIIVGRRH